MKKIALFSHDAGSSEILLELIRANLDLGDFRIFCLKESPCRALAKTKELESFIEIITCEDDIFKQLSSFHPSLILYGTGWQNHIEYHFLEYAKEHKLPSIAFLDHWTNYRERFGYPNEEWRENLPDFIATHDKESFELAKSLDLPNVIDIKNYAQMREILSAKEIFSKTKEEDLLLFLTEPTVKVAQKSHGDANYWGFDEESVFRDILANKSLFDCQNILIRLHPSDSPLSYKKIDPTAIFSDKTLLEDIARAKIIIGIDTIALQSAYLLGKKVISYIPSNNRSCVVPLPKENKIQSFENFEISSLKTATIESELFGMDFAQFLKNLTKTI